MTEPSESAQSSDSSSGDPGRSEKILSDYQRLKDWYLARLRQEAVQRGAVHLTPAALVAADKSVVEQLALAAAGARRSRDPSAGVKPAGRTSTMQLIVAVVLLPIISLTILCFPLDPTTKYIGFIGLSAIFICVIVGLVVQWRTSKNMATLSALLAVNEQIASIDALSKAVEKLLLSHDELVNRESLIADLSPEFLCLLDGDGKLLAWNATFARQSGCQPAALYKKPVADILTPDTRDVFRAVLQQARKATSAVRAETKIAGTGSTAGAGTGATTGVGTGAGAGAAHGVSTGSASSLDISWTIEWSQSSQSYFAVGTDVTTERMVQRTRDEFVAMIGHDIRTPLSAVTANLQTLQEGVYGDLNEQAKQCVDRSYNNARRLIGLISEMLDMEAAQTGKLQLDRKPTDIGTLIEGVVKECEELARKKSISIQCQLEPATANVDAGKIIRVLSNLLVNAINYSPDNTEVQVTCQASTTYIEVGVVDQGPGVAKEEQKLIFQRYYRGQKQKDSPGSGLGLAICKTIIESHGGLIGVKSTPPNGSRFWFTLPLN